MSWQIIWSHSERTSDQPMTLLTCVQCPVRCEISDRTPTVQTENLYYCQTRAQILPKIKTWLLPAVCWPEGVVPWALASGHFLFLSSSFWPLLVFWHLPLALACVLSFTFCSLLVPWALSSDPWVCLEFYLLVLVCVLRFTFWSLLISWDLPSGFCLCLEPYLQVSLLIPWNKIVSSFCRCYLWALHHHIRS
jgi:hypothetical protein